MPRTTHHHLLRTLLTLQLLIQPSIIHAKLQLSPHCPTNLPTHSSLANTSTIILHLPPAFHDLRTGGPADFFELHHALLAANHSTHMSAQNKHFAKPHTTYLPEHHWNAILTHGLPPHALLVLPEIIFLEPSDVDKMQVNGGRVLRWQLGMHFGSSHRLNTPNSRMDLLSSTEFTHTTYLVKGLHVLATSIEKIFFQQEHNLATTAKENLVLVDDDTRIDLDLFQEKLIEQLGAPVTVTQMKGFTRNASIQLLLKSKVFVDLHLPGKERATHEAVMLHNCLILGTELNGDETKGHDFPSTTNTTRVDGLDMNSIVRGVVWGLLNHQECVDNWEELRIKTKQATSNLIVESDRLFRGRHVQFMLVARNSVELHDVWPQIVSILIAYPLSDINVLIPNDCSSGWAPENEYWCLHAHGGLKIKTLLESFGLLNHVHFRRFNHTTLSGAWWKFVLPLQQKRLYTMYVEPDACVIGSQLLNQAAHALGRTGTPHLVLENAVLVVNTKLWVDKVTHAPSRVQLHQLLVELERTAKSIIGDAQERGTRVVPSFVDIVSRPTLSTLLEVACVVDKMKQLQNHAIWKLCGDTCLDYFNPRNVKVDPHAIDSVVCGSSNSGHTNHRSLSCLQFGPIAVDHIDRTFVWQTYEDPTRSATGFSWHYRLEEKHQHVVDTLSNMIAASQDHHTTSNNNPLVLRTPSSTVDCEIVIVCLDRKASHTTGVHHAQSTTTTTTDYNFFLDVGLLNMYTHHNCRIVAQKTIGHVDLDNIGPLQLPIQKRMVILAATLSMDGGDTADDVRTARSNVITTIMKTTALLRRSKVTHSIGLFLLRDEFLTLPKSIYSMFDVVLRHHYGENEIKHTPNTLWLPLGFDPGYVAQQNLPYAMASERTYMTNWIGNIRPKFYIGRLNATIINPSRQNLHTTLVHLQQESTRLNSSWKYFIHSNAYYSGWDSVHLFEHIKHTHVPLSTFKKILEDSVFTIIPCSINTIDAARLYQALESGSIPVLEGPIDTLMLPLGWYMPNHPHPFPVVQGGRWDVHLMNVFDKLMSGNINALQQQCQEWWRLFKQTTSGKVASALEAVMSTTATMAPRQKTFRRLQHQSLSDVSNHAYYHLDMANKAYTLHQWHKAITCSGLAVQLEMPMFQQSGIPSLELMEALIVEAQAKFSRAFSKASSFKAYSDVVVMMEDAKENAVLALALAPRLSRQMLDDDLHDLYLLLAEISLMTMEWRNALDWARKGLIYFPASTRSLDIVATAKWRLKGTGETESETQKEDETTRTKASVAELKSYDKWNGVVLEEEIWCLWRNISCKSFYHIGERETGEEYPGTR